MKRTKKRWLWILVSVFFGLGALAAYLYYFMPTNAALRRAEGFEFRRMQVVRISNGGTYRFFFATNRAQADNVGPPEARFGSTREAGLRLGSFDIRISPTLGLGRWLDASSWFLDEEIKIISVRDLDQADFSRQVREMVAASPQHALLLLVHGYRTDFDYALRGTAFLASVLDINAPVMVFDWPGNQGDSLSGYRRAQRTATESGVELAETLRLIARHIRPERLWLVANSMGGQVVVDALGQLYRERDIAGQGPRIDDLVLTAPDVDYGLFNEKLKAELATLVHKTTVYVSSNDRALLISRVVNRGRRLGQSTLSKGDADLVDEVEGLLSMVEPDSDNLSLVDVTPVNRTRNFHNFSLETPEYFDDIFMRLTNPETPRNRLRYRFQTPEGKTYSVLTRDR
jgi:esterase/lipase superfamily enzyme